MRANSERPSARGVLLDALSARRDDGGRLEEIPRDREVVVTCATGYRSSIAASLLRREGVEQIADLVGGLNAWEASRLKTAA